MRYSKIDRRMWGDKKFCSLSAPQPNAQTLWVFLLTCPMSGSIPGLYRMPHGALAELMGWEHEDLEEVFQEVIAKGMVLYDHGTQLVWLPRALQYNFPASPNVVLSWREQWDELPECDIKRKARTTIREQLQMFGTKWVTPFDSFTKSSRKASENLRQRISKPLANQEQEQEQEKYLEPAQTSFAPLVKEKTGASSDQNTSTSNGKFFPYARKVCAELGLSGRGPETIIAGIIATESNRWSEEPEVIAEALVRCRRSYESIPHNGVFVWPAKAFFEQGIWKQSKLWKTSRPSDAEVGKWDGTVSTTSECFRCRATFISSEGVEGIFCSEECAAAKPEAS